LTEVGGGGRGRTEMGGTGGAGGAGGAGGVEEYTSRKRAYRGTIRCSSVDERHHRRRLWIARAISDVELRRGELASRCL
jgi:hypothetical protein